MRANREKTSDCCCPSCWRRSCQVGCVVVVEGKPPRRLATRSTNKSSRWPAVHELATARRDLEQSGIRYTGQAGGRSLRSRGVVSSEAAIRGQGS